jgi:zinc protease
MKKILVIIGLLAIQTGLVAQQLDRSKLPIAKPAPQIKLGKVDNFTMANGLKVYVVTNTKVPRVAINLVLDRDPLFEGDVAGYTETVGSLLTTGTKNRTKDQFDEETDLIGASISASSTGVYASSLKKHLNKMMELASDVILNPNFTQEELDKVKKQQLSGLADANENPNAIAAKVTSKVLFGANHPYGETSSKASVEKITLEVCQKYYDTYFKPNIGYLAIVGDISSAEARALVQKYLGQWKAGIVPKHKIATDQTIAKSKVILVDRPNAVQSVIRIVNHAKLELNSPDVIKARIANDILGGGEARLYNNLREKHGYTYGAYSGLQADRHMGRFSAQASVRNAVTDSSIVEFMKELNAIVAQPVQADELARTKSDLMGTFVFSLEQPQTVANFAINTARYNLPQDYYTNYLKNIEATTLADVQAMAQRYIKPANAYIVVVGKASEIASKLKSFGEIEYYDVEGNKTTAPVAAKAIPEGLTAQTVLNKYITAIGGANKIKAITDITMEMKGTIPNGPELTINILQKAPGSSVQEVKVMGNTMQKVVTHAGKTTATQAGVSKEQAGDELVESLAKAKLFYEANPEAAGIAISLQGSEKVEGADCHKIELKAGKSTWAEYYDATTGLKTRTVQSQTTPQGEMQVTIDYQDYKAVDGVLLPHAIIQSFGPMKVTMKAVNIAVNKGIADELFK